MRRGVLDVGVEGCTCWCPTYPCLSTPTLLTHLLTSTMGAMESTNAPPQMLGCFHRESWELRWTWTGAWSSSTLETARSRRRATSWASPIDNSFPFSKWAAKERALVGGLNDSHKDINVSIWPSRISSHIIILIETILIDFFFCWIIVKRVYGDGNQWKKRGESKAIIDIWDIPSIFTQNHSIILDITSFSPTQYVFIIFTSCYFHKSSFFSVPFILSFLSFCILSVDNYYSHWVG